MLERMSGPLCEAVLDQPGAGVVLAELARSNLLLVPLDRRGQWYRYHHLFRDMLLAELERLEPGLIPVLRRRAAGWCQGNGQPEEALEYSIAAGDVEAAARLMEELYLPVYRQGRIATLQRWFQWLGDRGGIEGHPLAAIWASSVAAVSGRPVEAERWADAVDRWQYHDNPRAGDPVAEAWAADCGARCAGGGSSKCAPTPTRQRTGSRRRPRGGDGSDWPGGGARPLRRQGRRRCVLGGRRQNRA